MPTEWFRRMGDIPGLDYTPPVEIDRTTLPRHDAVPELHRFEFDGRVHESLRWEYTEVEDGEEVSTSGSPAHAIAFGGLDVAGTSLLLTRLWQCLELPGEASDYHFAIQQVVGSLWSRRIHEPEVLAWMEFLNWLDIKLIRAYPNAVRDEYAEQHPGRSQFYSVSAFGSLIGMYSREGFLAEALGVARIAEEFDQGEQLRAELEERLELLRAEDGV